jgi:hypothetical protein
LEAYAEVLHYKLNGFGIDSVLVDRMCSESFHQFFASDQAPDPQEVADASPAFEPGPCPNEAIADRIIEPSLSIAKPPLSRPTYCGRSEWERW